MTSLFDFFGRMIEGKPVFSSGETKPEVPPSPPVTAPPEGGIRKGDEHSFPMVSIKPRITTHTNGNNIEIYGHIINTWHDEVWLDRIRLADTERRLDAGLRAGEDREYLLYKGPKLQHEYHEAWLDYKTKEERDYFRAVHIVTYTYHPEDKSYTVDEMQLHHPIRDIYE